MARNNAPQEQVREEPELIERLVGINRVAKVVKGGRRFGFAALVVVGDGKGRVGYGSGKAKEVPEAIKKATDQAKRDGAGRVLLRSAPVGTGIIAGGPMRAVFEAVGIQDIVAKAIGSNNPYSMVNATFAALKEMQSPRHVAGRRNRKVSDIVSNREIGKDSVAVEGSEE